ncbi:chloramphenicol phosphotransferase CPT family protein [Streptomyces sp. HK10]|uniref:chloramphenicol phosphotransferase CPT family protein n=1 Tax=Streptomyces sp. HK10 TaxID=3373255 RepID=UPI003748CA0C
MDSGRMVFLNSTSSSGKSSIATELLQTLDGPWFHMPVDVFHAMRTKRDVDPAELPAVLRRTWEGFHRAVAGMASAGNDIVVDHVLSERWRLLDCLALFEPRNVLLVGVHCSPEELRRREGVRGDRPPGLAEHQLDLVHAHGVYDVECDTTTASPAECAQRIRDALTHHTGPTAFERLRRTHVQPGPLDRGECFP